MNDNTFAQVNTEISIHESSFLSHSMSSCCSFSSESDQLWKGQHIIES